MAPTPVFLPGEFHGQRSLGGYSPQGGRGNSWGPFTSLECFTAKKKKLLFVFLFHYLWRPYIDTQIKSGQIFYSYTSTFSSMSEFLLANFFNHLRTNIGTLWSQLIVLSLIIINNKAQCYFSDEKSSFYSCTEALLPWSIKTENLKKGNTLNRMQIFQMFFFKYPLQSLAKGE